MNRADGTCTRVFLGVLLVISGLTGGVATAQIGPPDMNPLGGFILPGQGLGIDESSIVDWDDNGGVAAQDSASITCVTVIDPCGNSYSCCEPTCDWRSLLLTDPGLWFVLVTLDDEGTYEDDDPITYEFSVEVDDSLIKMLKEKCPSCGPTQMSPDIWPLPGQQLATIRSVYLTFPLGTTIDGKSAGTIWAHEEEPSLDMALASSLHYNVQPVGVEKYEYGVDDEFQVLTPQVLVDVAADPPYKYTVSYYSLDNLGSWSVNHYVQTAQQIPFRRIVVENPTQDPNDYDQLYVTEYRGDGQSAPIPYLRHVYDGENESEDWTLSTYELDAQGNVQGSALRTEELEWVAGAGDTKQLQYHMYDASHTEVYCAHDTYTEYEYGGWRRTAHCVDPNGLSLTTSWTYEDDPNTGIIVSSVQRPNGSWTRYSADRSAYHWELSETSGHKDQSYDISGPGDPDVSQVYLQYEMFSGIAGLHLAEATNNTPGAGFNATYDYDDDWLGRVDTVEETQILTTGHLVALRGYWNGNRDRLDYVYYPDGRRDDYDYIDDIAISSFGALPSVPPSYNTGGTGHYYYREVVHGKRGGEITPVVLVAYKSTKDVVISNGGGQPILSEVWVYTGSGEWTRIQWTAWTYDVQNRLTGVYHSNGTSETTVYNSCCGKTVTDETGVQMGYNYDRLGRLEQTTRFPIRAYSGGGASYAAQPAITTSYDYDTAGEVTLTVQGGDDPNTAQVTTREYDKAGRVSTVTTGAGSGTLKTLYEYGSTAAGGLKVTVYNAYPASAQSGTPGTRDRITEYYCDGTVKSVTGSTVVDAYYDSGGSGALRWREVRIGAAESPRYEKTWYDELWRIYAIDRPGWTSEGSVTLTTYHNYDNDTGLLTSIQTPGQADTRYEYDDCGKVEYSGLDLNDDGDLTEASTDRLKKFDTKFECDENDDWWQVSRSWAYATDNVAIATPMGSRWTRLSGFSGGVVQESKSIDSLGNETVWTTTLGTDPNDALATTTVDYPDASGTSNEATITHGGWRVSFTSKEGVTSTYCYDDYGRETESTDGRGNTTSTSYDESGRAISVEDEAGNKTEYGYYPDTASGEGAYPGRLNYAENAADKRTYYGYSDRGDVIRVWGDMSYPTETLYDAMYGERIGLKTYRDGDGATWTTDTWPATPPTADATTWSYHAATGLLERKEDADGKSTSYTYTSEGRLHTRAWARDSGSIVTTYDYGDDPNTSTGDLTDIDYSDGTPDVTFSYNRLGYRDQVTDAAGTRTLAYDSVTLQPTTETFGAGMFNERVITQTYDGNLGRFVGLQVGTSSDPNAYYAAGYGYDATTGRLNQVTGPGLPAGSGAHYGAWYSFVTGSDLVDKLTIEDNSEVLAWTDWTYDADRDLITSVQNNFGDLSTYTTISEYGYGLNSLGQRTHKNRSGLAFSASWHERYGYNDRIELTGSDYYTGLYPNGSADGSKDHSYTYDNIGNRLTYITGEDTGSEEPLYYGTNELNQYGQIALDAPATASQRLDYDDDGNLTEIYVAGDVNCDGQVTYGDIDCFVAAIGCPPTPGGYDPNNCCADCLRGDANGDGEVDYDDLDPFVNLIGSGGLWVAFEWDAENRLTAVIPQAPDAASKKVTFKYDYMNRRIEKAVYDWVYDGITETWSWSEAASSISRFVYTGWRPVLELDGSGNVVRKYTWGRDLSGTPGGAGGIGGLLAVYDAGETDDYVYFYDANGNVGQVVDLSVGDPNDAAVARYEYDPYGGVTLNLDDPNYVGPYGAENPMRFSTKYFDDETGLGYWGERYYWPKLGRWINRDPIGELGGENLYAHIGNDPTGGYDPLGQQSRTTVATGGVLAKALTAADLAIAAIRTAATVGAAYAAYYAALQAIAEVETIIGAVAGDIAYRCVALRTAADEALKEAIKRIGDGAPAPKPKPKPKPKPEPKVDPVPPLPPPDSPPKDPWEGCAPCQPPRGTTAYMVHTTHPHNGMNPHTHHYEMHQSPAPTCQCFWKRNYVQPTPGVSPLPGEIPFPLGPARGGGRAGPAGSDGACPKRNTLAAPATAFVGSY